MKLSEMNTKQLAAALCQLTATMGRIARDDNLNGAFAAMDKKMKEGGSMTVLEKMGEMLGLVPVLLEYHYADTIRIIAIMTGRADAEVETLNGYQMINELRACIDSQFLDFFRSSAVMDKISTGKEE